MCFIWFVYCCLTGFRLSRGRENFVCSSCMVTSFRCSVTLREAHYCPRSMILELWDIYYELGCLQCYTVKLIKLIPISCKEVDYPVAVAVHMWLRISVISINVCKVDTRVCKNNFWIKKGKKLWWFWQLWDLASLGIRANLLSYMCVIVFVSEFVSSNTWYLLFRVIRFYISILIVVCASYHWYLFWSCKNLGCCAFRGIIWWCSCLDWAPNNIVRTIFWFLIDYRLILWFLVDYGSKLWQTPRSGSILQLALGWGWHRVGGERWQSHHSVSRSVDEKCW